MTVKITILGDTHLNSFEELSKEILKELQESDWVIHVGDYTSPEIVSGLIDLKGERFRGVYGNADPIDVRNMTKSKDIIEILGKKIGITHPAFGGSDENLEDKVLNEFANEDLDIIIFGHSHDSRITTKNNVLMINPGKGYLETNYFGPPTTIAILTINNDKFQGEIKEIKS
ncbi:MAG: metallophosphoesterase family protein [Promethearchaeota archaeon]|jgi:putative phosphoesterase